MVKNPPPNAGDIRDAGSVPGGEHSNPLQYCCLKHLRDRGAWRAAVDRVAESDMTGPALHVPTHATSKNWKSLINK